MSNRRKKQMNTSNGEGKVIYLNFMNVVFTFIIIWEVITLIGLIINPHKEPSLFGFKTFQIVSGSMEPELSVNDIVIVKKVKQKKIKEGDIITFKNRYGEIVTYRVYYVARNTQNDQVYGTKGDANNTEDDGQVSYENIEGKYVGKIPRIGKILRNKAIVIILVVILLIAVYINGKINKAKRRRKRTRRVYEMEREKGM